MRGAPFIGPIAAALLCALAGCYATRPQADGADTNTNWLQCRSDDDCSDGRTCQAGVCRLPEAMNEASETPAVVGTPPPGKPTGQTSSEPPPVQNVPTMQPGQAGSTAPEPEPPDAGLDAGVPQPVLDGAWSRPDVEAVLARVAGSVANYPLLGLPMAVQDNICAADYFKTTEDNTTIRRAIIEFVADDVAAAVQAGIVGATFELVDGSAWISSHYVWRFQVSVYAADGVLTVEDYTREATPFATLEATSDVQEGWEFDVTELVRERVAAGEPAVGFRIQLEDEAPAPDSGPGTGFITTGPEAPRIVFFHVAP